MKTCILAVSFIALYAHSASGQSDLAHNAQGGTIAFVDVHVVPMDREQVLQHQTVLVRRDLITTIGAASSTTVPTGAERIEGHGRLFLFPGLADMHTHIQEMDDLALYVINGVTSILDMGLAPSRVVARANEWVGEGVMVGPQIFFAAMIDGSPAIHGFGVTSPEQARAAVQLAKANGYHFVKVYNNLSSEAFKALCEESKRQGLAVIGHGVRSVGLPRALSEGQVMVAHAEELYYTTFARQTDRAGIAKAAAAIRDTGAFVTPNLSTFETISQQWGKPDVVRSFLADARAKQMSPSMRLLWLNMDYVRRDGSIEAIVPFLRELTKGLQDAGVPLLAGTDSPIIPGMYPGHSIHTDIASLREAGLTTYEALSAATRTAGEFVAKYVPETDRFGIIRPGARADMILLQSNPLQNVETLRSPLGVMSAGRWQDANELKNVMQQQVAKYESLLK